MIFIKAPAKPGAQGALRDWPRWLSVAEPKGIEMTSAVLFLKAMGLLAGAALLVAFVAAGAEAMLGKRKFR